MGEYQIIYWALLICYHKNNNKGWHLLSVYYMPGKQTTTLYYRCWRQPPFLWLPVFMWKDLCQCKTLDRLLTPSFSLGRVTHFIVWLGRRNQMYLAQSQLELLLDFGLLTEFHSKHSGADLSQERGLQFLFLPVPSENVNVGVQKQEAIISKYLNFLIQFY